VAKREHEEAAREQKKAIREQRKAAREHREAEREHIDETGVSGRAKRRPLSQRAVSCWSGFGDAIYIYIHNTMTFA